MFKEKNVADRTDLVKFKDIKMPLTKKDAQQVTRKRDATNTKHKRSKVF